MKEFQNMIDNFHLPARTKFTDSNTPRKVSKIMFYTITVNKSCDKICYKKCLQLKNVNVNTLKTKRLWKSWVLVR